MNNSKSYGTNAIYNATEDYRYGFNGMEKEKNIGQGFSDFGARMYDSEFPSFGSPDPLEGEFPYQSTYVFAGNNPVKFIDLNGEKINVPDIFTSMDSFIKGKNRISVIYNFIDNAVKGGGGKILQPGDENYETLAKIPDMVIEVNIYDANLSTSIAPDPRVIASGENIKTNGTLVKKGQISKPNYSYTNDDFANWANSLTKNENLKKEIVDEFLNGNNKKPIEDQINKLEEFITNKFGDGLIAISSVEIGIDSRNESSVGNTLAHELGSFLEALENPLNSWIWDTFIDDDSRKGGHRFDFDYHKKGAEKGEKLYKDNR